MADLNVDRFLKVAKLLDGAATDGEKLAALARLNEMLKNAGKSWSDVLKLDARVRPLASSDVQNIANANMVLATLRAAGLSLPQVSAVKGLQERLEADRKAFEHEKERWRQQQRDWQRRVTQEQQERLQKQHEEDLQRHRGQATQQSSDNGPYAPNIPPRHPAGLGQPQGPWNNGLENDGDLANRVSPQWRAFAKTSRARAEWIVDHYARSEFASSLMAWVMKTGRLTPKQAEAVDRAIDRDDDWDK